MGHTPARGRPPKLTPAVQARIVAELKAGVTKSTAARRAGVAPSALYRWLADGRKTGAKFASQRAFRAAVGKALADAEAAHLISIVRAGRPHTETTVTLTTFPDGRTETKIVKQPVGDWRAAAWWLERMYPERYGSERRAIRELRKQLARLEAMLAPSTPPADAEGFPRLAAAN